MQNSNSLETPWYIKLLLAISGWVGAIIITLAISLFFFTIHISENSFPYIAIPFGATLTILAIKNLQNIDSEFKEHFLLAISFIGQILIVISIFILFKYKYSILIYSIIALFQIALIIKVNQYIHRVMNAFFASIALNTIFFLLGAPWFYYYILIFTISYLFINIYYFKEIKKFESIAYGLLFSLIFMLFYNFSHIYTFYFYYQKKVNFITLAMLFNSIFYGIIYSYIIYNILKTYNSLKNKRIVFLALISVIIVGLLAIKTQGIAIGMILIIIGFFISNRLIEGIGILLMIIFTSKYYYNLNETLLYKSIILLIIGILLLTFRFMFKKLVEVK